MISPETKDAPQMAIRLAFEQTPVEAAWAAYDAAAIRLHSMHQQAAFEPDTMAGSADRRELALEVARLWKEFEALFSGEPGPGEAA